MQFAFGQNVTSALIGHAFSDNNTIVFNFKIHTNAEVQTLPDSTISVTLSDIAQNIHIPITNFRLISQVQERIGCDSSSDTKMHQYSASVDLTDSKYAALSSSCILRGELVVANRVGGNTTTNANNRTIYVYDEFEMCSQKLSNRNTHQSVSNGMFYSCVNQPSTYYIGAFDLAEFDSLSYELVNPMINRSTSTNYKSGLSANQPFSVSASTQFSFDSAKGEFTFSPSDTTENLASVSIKTTEWRKNNAGTYMVVGTSMREVLIFIEQCQSNNPPVISGRASYEVCEGEQICFTIQTDDKIKVPPPPLPAPKKDSVSIRWNRGIPEATFTVIDPKEIHQQARFCWTTKLGDADSLPHTFIVTARDDFCPENATVHKIFSVYVTPSPVGSLKIRPISDSSFSVKVNIPTAHDESNYKTKISLEDLNTNPITDREIGYFLRSYNDSSIYLVDTLIMRQSMKFRLTTTVSAKSNNNCSIVFHDTLNFHTSSVLNKVTNRLNIFPNPTTGAVNLDFSLKQVEVRNSIGKMMWFCEVTDEIDLISYPPGVYTISGMFDNKWYTGKVIKY